MGGIRTSIHYYNTEEDIDALLAGLLPFHWPEMRSKKPACEPDDIKPRQRLTSRFFVFFSM